MKKLFILFLVLVFTLVISACSEKVEESSLTLDQFIKAYTDAGVDVDSEEKPLFAMIGAKDGVIFNIDGSKVAIYEYADIKTLNDQKKENGLIKEWPSNGKFILEASKENAIEIFNNVK